MTSSLRRSSACLGLALTASLLLAPTPATAAPPAVDADPLKGLEFRNIGPASMGGRIDDFAVVESNPSVFFVGTASGGIFKTTNRGTTFEPVFDDQLVSTIGDLRSAPSIPDPLPGTGEPNNRQSSSWERRLPDARRREDLAAPRPRRHPPHRPRARPPRNPDVVYVAALGRLWGREPRARPLQDDRRRRT
jgi:hypothetical protein